MSLYATIKEDYKTAFKEKNRTKKDILNFVIAQLKNKEIDSKEEITDDIVIKTFKKEIKTRKEAMGFLQQQGKQEDYDLEQAKIDILTAYLPEEMSEEQVQEAVKAAIEELGITDVNKEKGKLIGALMKKYGSAIDGGMVNRVVSHYA